MRIVSLIILLFLWHIPSAVIPIVTSPAPVVLSFIPMYFFGISSNIMSLRGIAVAIGALVDARRHGRKSSDYRDRRVDASCLGSVKEG